METNKELIIGNEGRIKVKAGIDKAASAVAPTLGAVGMTASIEYPGLDPVDADDGVTILKSLKFKDHHENIGLQKLRKAAVRTSTEGGDGTATTTVLTQAFVAEAFKEISNDSSKIREVRERLEKGLHETLSELSKIKREVTEEDIEKIATISSLDPEVAKLIAEVIKEVGVNGVVTVEKGSKIGYSKEVVKGARFNKGIISPYFINNPDKGECVIENPYIILADRKLSTNGQVTSIMQSIQDSGNLNVLFIADDVDSLALATLIQNNSTVTVMDPETKATKKGTFNIACVRNPYTASRATDFLHDIAALTGGTVISEQAGMKLDNATVKELGVASKVVVTKETTTIMAGQQTEALKERIALVEKLIEESVSDYEKLMLEDRLACLTGGIGVIRVGAYTDTEFNAKKYKFENAVNATQAALQEGIIAGGGKSLAFVGSLIKEPIFKNALRAPVKQMAINAGMTESRNWFDKLLRKPLKASKVVIGVSNICGPETGYDFRKKVVTNMFDAGIIDPFKVTRLALESATAIAISLVSNEVFITEEDEIEND